MEGEGEGEVDGGRGKERERSEKGRNNLQHHIVHRRVFVLPESMNTVDEFRHIPHVIDVSHYRIEYLDTGEWGNGGIGMKERIRG